LKSENIEQIQKRIQDNYYSFDSTEYRSIIKSINWEIKKNSENKLLHYYFALANINLCRIIYNTNKDGAHSAIVKATESTDILIETIENNSNFKNQIGGYGVVEFYALHSQAYGLRTGLELTTKIKWGRLAKSTIETAYKLDSNNRKVLLVAAKHLMCTPTIFGGDKNEAARLLWKAVNLKSSPHIFKNKNGENLNYGLVSWGEKAELYAYLAQLEVFKGNRKTAQKYMKKALELENEYGYVLYDLEEQL
jgi:tetratricopeptide (TPR) repeat protein